MNMPFHLKKSTLKSWYHALMYQWIKRYRILFFFLFLIVSGWGGYEWYMGLERYHWTDEERQDYLQRTVKETTFEKDKYTEALAARDKLAAEHATPPAPARDLFAGKTKKNP